ncbi:hypothetical protein [Mucilaginibacter pedocola]|uniref:hypothetical protein n=1 Tax=Mucilaginibacter pedocola TaxID=1792845 RepID=UPI0013902B4D|nr:hypothetical protein [Mucilaginibacter pedocola]
MLFIVAYETASFYKVFSVNHSNLWAVNIVELIEFMFYSFSIYTNLGTARYKRPILIAIVGSIIYSVLSLLLIHGFWKLNISGILLQTLVIIVACGVYFRQLISLPSAQAFNLLKQPGFWLNTGVLFFYLGEFLFFASFSYLAYKNSFAYLQFWMVVSSIANVLLYGCLIACFLYVKPSTR